MHERTLTAVIAVAVALLIAACGSSSTKSSSTAAAPAPASSSPPSSKGPYGSPNPGAGTAAQAALITTKHDSKLGRILAVGPKRLTVYMFEKDKAESSSCSGPCAKVWPPVSGKPQATGGALNADLGTVKRADGTTQVTYKGHPLYLYAKDKDDGDTYGQGINSFGADWYALAPSGKKVDLS